MPICKKIILISTLTVGIASFSSAYDDNALYECQNMELLQSISAWHIDVRNSGIEGCKKEYGWTDDELSERLLVLAEYEKTDKRLGIRDFVLGAIMDFGTTNALEYVKREALCGPDFAVGLASFALITGFDQRCFDLADTVFAEKRSDTTIRKVSFLGFLSAAYISHMADGEYYGRKITLENQARIIDYLLKSAETVDECSKTADRILLECVPSYKDSETRKYNIRHAVECLPTNSVAYRYFKVEQTKLAMPEKAEHISTANDKDKTALSSCKLVIAVAGILILSAIGWYFYFRRTKKS